jgi:hypothetical protein
MTVPDGLLPALLIVFAVAAWVISKVLHYSRKSEAQWRQVDQSKLRHWDDEDDW